MDNASPAPHPTIGAFHPSRRIRFGPGPSDLHPRVMATPGQTVIGYLAPVCVGMETCGVNLVEPGDKVWRFAHLIAAE